jgi:hypothetical protein
LICESTASGQALIRNQPGACGLFGRRDFIALIGWRVKQGALLRLVASLQEEPRIIPL